MLTKKEYTNCLKELSEFAEISLREPYDFEMVAIYEDDLKKLIEEVFNPKSFEFEDIKCGMYVYDSKYKAIGKVSEILTNCNCQRLNIQYNGNDIVCYENDRFYPVIVPQNTDMEEKKNDY